MPKDKGMSKVAQRVDDAPPTFRLVDESDGMSNQPLPEEWILWTDGTHWPSSEGHRCIREYVYDIDDGLYLLTKGWRDTRHVLKSGDLKDAKKPTKAQLKDMDRMTRTTPSGSPTRSSPRTRGTSPPIRRKADAEEAWAAYQNLLENRRSMHSKRPRNDGASGSGSGAGAGSEKKPKAAPTKGRARTRARPPTRP
mmetsp:Transcript_45107/g.143660  ORF Transcript_45107/g.143660 Transcript_45107/m.143660 type:complete len:195 (-) Transcript_45107:324-908(-)